MNRQKIKCLVKALYLYSNGIDNTPIMDNLSMECTDGEWNFVCQMNDFIDELEVDNELATLYQVEKVYSVRENRNCRYPRILASIFKSDEENRQIVKLLAEEYTKRGIKFKERIMLSE